MQFYNGEDPATGSASGCTIAYLVRYSLVGSGLQAILEQGIEINRPSRIFVEASSIGTELHSVQPSIKNVFVGGRTIPVAMGRFFLP